MTGDRQTMCDTIIRQIVSLQEAWNKNDQIDPRLNTMSSSELHKQLVALRNQLSFPEQLLWFLFKGYDPRLRQLQTLVMNTEPADMKILFDALPGTPCGFSDSRLSGSDELNDNGLLNAEEAGLLTTYPATCGQYDDYLFVPNEITHSEILSIIGDEEEYEDSRSSGFKTEASFCLHFLIFLASNPHGIEAFQDGFDFFVV